ncbi:phage terminase large subunit family protein [Microcoleus sp. herbarium7]|uniref:phage terminase large subunit family protein n=1 Tax=Microcoleus sp. herbarium7 TaxID=3055435 RepID=UPI002FD13D80
MPRHHRLTAANHKAIAKSQDPAGLVGRQLFADQTQEQKQRAIARFWYGDGHLYFQEWIKENYRTHTGQPLHWDEPFFEGFIAVMANPWLLRVTVIKGAQMGFSEMLIALVAFSLVELRSSTMYCVDEKLKLMDIVAPRVQPAFDNIKSIQMLRLASLKLRGRKDTDTKQRNVDVGGVPVYFAFAGRAGGATQGRQVSSSLSSVPIEFGIIADEVEAFPPGALNILLERTSASTLPTSPLRCGSTPGAEGGVVDVEVKTSQYFFDWYIFCPHCESGQFLSPKGNLFRPLHVEGKSDLQYFDSVGNPLDWFCTDSSSLTKRIETSYLGCRHCAGELSREQIAQGSYRCHHTGESLKAFTERTQREKKPISDGIALRLPRLASKLFKLQERLSRLAQARNISDRADSLQQGFGEVSSFGAGRIDKSLLLECIGRPLPDAFTTPDLIVVGADQGLGHQITVVTYWYWGEGVTEREKWERAHCEVKWFGSAYRMEGIEELASEWKADFVGIDMNPEAYSAGQFAQKFRPERSDGGSMAIENARGKSVTRARDYFTNTGIVFLFYQTALKGEEFRQSTRTVQGEEYPAFALDRTFGLDSVLELVHSGRLHLPADWAYDPRDKESFLYQMLTSERTAKAQWIEGNEPDHAFHALNFAAVTAMCWSYLLKPTPFVFGGVGKKKPSVFY